ncbi:MAG: DEAD/DEAH box helicase [Chloroflexi bacterium]|nr:DEAD/DEAH box helicase [Chloroflexota bacterium]OJV90112.1 MAG: RNA helicase [Chloroflexi bacterium 54-19]
MTATFTELGLSELTLKALNELGYEEPTPIQTQTINLLLQGQDVIAQAQTGTGKTAAFALPIIEKLDENVRATQALILTPTRELAMQVAEAFHSYGKYRRLSVLPVYGGQPIERQLRALRQGMQIVVGTPGRVLDHIRRGTLELQKVQFIALDEADEMLDMGFVEDIESILKEVPEDRQMALFSATMPTQIANLAKRYMQQPQRITIKAEQTTVPQIRQVYYEVGRRDKFEVLVRVLDYERPTSAIIFCRTKLEVDSLGQRLSARAYSAETLHGDLNQGQRDRVMALFRGEKVELLIATDVAARGLDIDHVSHVINYDIPLDPESYVHRIGRTGRAGRTGCAITLVTTRERRLWQMIQKVTGASLQRMPMPTIEDVIERRQEQFKDSIRDTLNQAGLERFLILVEELADEFSPAEIAAAAFKMLLGPATEETEDKLAGFEDSEVDYDRPASRLRRERESERQPGTGIERGMSRLYLKVGWNDGVRPGDIVGAIANEGNIPGRSIGAIEIHDDFTSVDVPSSEANRVMRATQETRIRNKKVLPTLAGPFPESWKETGQVNPDREKTGPRSERETERNGVGNGENSRAVSVVRAPHKERSYTQPRRAKNEGSPRIEKERERVEIPSKEKSQTSRKGIAETPRKEEAKQGAKSFTKVKEGVGVKPGPRAARKRKEAEKNLRKK